MFISLFNPQGNFDKHDSLWASHPDFGGQLVYVKELAVTLASMGHKVDIVTRQIIDKDWPWFSEPFDSYDGVDNLRIVRINFGGNKFLNKEELWPYLCADYVEKIIALYMSEGKLPDAVAAHYGDGGLAAAYFKAKTGIPYTFTAHSLGAQKMDKFNIGRHNVKAFDVKFNFASRLLAERISINNAGRIVTSTTQERFSQYSHISYKDAVMVDDEARFAVIPPGVSLKTFDRNNKINKDLVALVEEKVRRDIRPDRVGLPVIISSSRPDPKKNIIGLVRAFVESEVLQQSANLMIITKGYDNILKDHKNIPKGEGRDVLVELIELIYEKKLNGKVTMFSLEKQEDLASTYRYLAKRRSVFCLTALYEPFGLAPIEAMACGLPAVATKFGGPTESLREGSNEFGLLVDPKDPDEVAAALYSLISSERKWRLYSEKGYERVVSKYTWQTAAKSYLKLFKEITGKSIKRFDVPNITIDKYFINPKKFKKPSSEILNSLYLNYDLLCIGEALIKFRAITKSLSLRHADVFERYPGGNPVNVSVLASKMSKKVAILTKLGRGHFGDFLESELKRYGLVTEYIKYSNETDTSVAFVSETKATPDLQIMHSADRKLSMNEIDAELIDRAEVVYTSLSSMSHEPSRAAILKALRIAKKLDKVIVLDPDYDAKAYIDEEKAKVVAVLVRACDGVKIVTPSLTNARYIFDYNLKDEELIDLCIENFHAWGAEIVCVIKDDFSVVLSDKSRLIEIDKIKTDNKSLDKLGSKEAFVAGFVVAYLEKLDMQRCALFAQEICRLTLKTRGPYPELIKKSSIMKRVMKKGNRAILCGILPPLKKGG